ncbi:predicted protein [Micromonas commoda]|uniref:Radical SAM core domain-containing protein n=1 Tax=Micromonas commoda (strain RCC299 / NOUM17 / CCMP2709) TaxID=296587 RepID=C1E6J0_MICCC|nr:predicted protein [Micromonas commoda]ACO63439.1 predicted protein [Micromonas commoda]|eukprot:XP_002502181.1 predicted protein [Micromonas commoda]
MAAGAISLFRRCGTRRVLLDLARERVKGDRLASSAASSQRTLLGLGLDELRELSAEFALPQWRGQQIHDAIYGEMRKTTIEGMQQLPLGFRQALVDAGYETGRREPVEIVSDEDGTRKALFELRCGSIIEAVGIPVERAKGRRRRFTVCVSSQVGCAMRCSFCATGRQGFRRNLTSDEIVNQVLSMEDVFGRRATNVVMMGMGEPLLNLREVLRAHRCLNRDVGIGGRYFTISTVGVPNALSKLAAHRLQATLAVSLHAPTQELRERLIPSAKAFPLDALLEEVRMYRKATGRRVTFEYTLLAGENDSEDHARALAKLLRSKVGRGCHINLLPWNPVAGANHQRPSKSAVNRFCDVLAAERGVSYSVRATRGLVAQAACGQLTGAFERKSSRSNW